MATKQDLILNLANRLEFLSEKDAKLVVNNIIQQCIDNLAKGNRIEIRGLGSLSIRERKYAGKNEKYKTVYYRMSKSIQDELK